MRRTTAPRPPTPRTAGPRQVSRWLLLAAIATAFAAAAPPARADGCDGCSGPTVERLQQEANFSLQTRGDPFTGYARDYVLTDAGECTATLAAPPRVTRLFAWLVLRGSGEVWNCPHSKSTDTITVESAKADSTEWSLKATSSIKMGSLVASAKLEIESGRTEGVTIREVTRISKTIAPSYCHRIAWQGFFEVSAFEAEAEFKFTQRWAWWTKNRKTGATVHAKGDVYMDCGSGTVELERTAPIAGFFRLSQRGCEATECDWVPEKLLGYFPELPPHLAAPVDEGPDEPGQNTTDEEEEPEPPLPPDDLGEPPGGPVPDPFAEEPEPASSTEDPEDPPPGPLPDPLTSGE